MITLADLLDLKLSEEEVAIMLEDGFFDDFLAPDFAERLTLRMIRAGRITLH